MHICATFSRLWWFANFASYRCCIIIILIGSVWMSFLRISVEIDFGLYPCRSLEYCALHKFMQSLAYLPEFPHRNDNPHACLSWLRHILFVTAKLAIKYYSLYPLWCFYFSINMSLKYSKMKLKLFSFLPILQRCSYAIYIIIIYVLVEFISLHFYVTFCNYIIENGL